MIVPFEASRLKLARARKHLSDLSAENETFFARKPCAVVVEDFLNGAVPGTVAFIARVKEMAPQNLAPIIGDIIHNLRTALDLLACDLVRIAGKNPSSVYFPFCETPDDLKQTIKKRNVDKAGKDVVAVIEAMQPYKGGNHILRAIHDMDVADKHKALLITIAAASLPLSDILGRYIKTPSNNSRWESIITDGQMLIGLPETLSPPLGTEIPSRFFLCFAEGSTFIKGRHVLEFLHQATDHIDGVIDTLVSLRPNAVFPDVV